MRDKVLSGLEMDISNILNSEDSDEIKAKSYISALAPFKNYSTPSKPIEEKAWPSPPAAVAAPTTSFPTPSASTVKAIIPLKCSRKFVKVESSSIVPSLDPFSWRRTQRSQTKKKFGSQWIEYNEQLKKKKKPRTSWIES